MKAVLIQPEIGPNPGYDHSAARAARRRGDVYDVPSEITYPAGTVVEHKDVWVHCVKSPPSMRPADAECAAIIQKWLQHKSRKALLAKFKHIKTPDVYKASPRWLQQYVDDLFDKWGPEFETVEPDTTATAAEIKTVIERMGGEVVEDEADPLIEE